MDNRGFAAVVGAVDRFRESSSGYSGRENNISELIREDLHITNKLLNQINKQVYKISIQIGQGLKESFKKSLEKKTISFPKSSLKKPDKEKHSYVSSSQSNETDKEQKNVSRSGTSSRPQPKSSSTVKSERKEESEPKRKRQKQKEDFNLDTELDKFETESKKFLKEFVKVLKKIKLPTLTFDLGNLITTPLKLAINAVLFPIKSVLFGSFKQIGQNLTDDFSKSLASQIQKTSKIDFGKIGEDVGQAAGKGLQKGVLEFVETVTDSISSEGMEFAPTAATFLKTVFDNVLMSLRDAMLAAPRAYQRMQYQRLALPLIKEQAGQMMIDNQLSPEEEESIKKSKSISLVVGGVNMDETAGNTDYVERLMKPLLQNSHVVPIKNTWSNAPYEPEFKVAFQNLVKTAFDNPVLAKIILENIQDNVRKMGDKSDFNALSSEDLADPKKASEKILEVLNTKDMPIGKGMEALFKGYNPDDVTIAANALYYRQQFPDKPINILGTSFGGFNAAGASQMLEMLGVEGIKGAGITTPFTGIMSPPDNENFLGSIGTEDFLYKAINQVLGEFDLRPEFRQVIEGAGKGHLLPLFLGNEQFQGRFQELFSDELNFKPGVDESSVNYLSKRYQNPEDENLLRTLLQLSGEPTDEGYTYNAEDLKGYTKEIKKKSKKIKDDQLKKEVAAYLEFLDALIEDLETVAGLKEFGISAKPNKSIKKATAALPNIKNLPLPDDQEVPQEVVGQINNFKNIAAFRKKLRSEKTNLQATLTAMQGGTPTEGWAFFDREEDRLGALQGFTDWLENGMLGDASDIEKGLAKPFLDFMKKLQEESNKLSEGGEFDTTLLAEFENLFGEQGEINKSLQLSGNNIQRYYAAYLQKIVNDAKKNAQQQIRTIAPNYQNLTVQQKRDFAKQFNQEIKQDVRRFREAITNGDRNLARELGEGLLAKIQSVKQVYGELIESAEDVSGRNSMQGQVSYLTAVENEIIQGQPNRRGMSNTGLTQLVSEATRIGDDTTAGFLQSINEDIGREIGVDFGQAVASGVQDSLDINSPSKLFEWIGEMVKKGFEKGVDGISNFLTQPIANVVNGIDESAAISIGNIRQGITDLFDSLLDKFPLLKEATNLILALLAGFLASNLIESLVGWFSSFANAAFDAVVQVESLEIAMASLSGSAERGARGLAFVRAEASRLGIELKTAEQAYAGLVAVTRFTPLQGLAADKIFTAFAETAALRGFSSEEQSRLFAALNQMISKRKLSAEEVRGQLGEIPGLAFESTLSRALGVNPAQMNEMMGQGQLLAEDVLPKVAAQYAAENATIAASSETTAQALSRFNNALTTLQRSFKEWIERFRIFFNIATSVLTELTRLIPTLVKVLTVAGLTIFIDNIGSLIEHLVKSKTLGSLFINFLKATASLLQYILPHLLDFLKKFLLVTLAIDAMGNAISIAQNAFPKLQKNIEETTSRVYALKTALEGVKKAANEIPTRQDLPTDENNINTSKTWNFLGIQTPFNLEPIRKVLGLRTLGSKEMADFQVGVGDLVTGINNNLFQQSNVEKVLADVKKIDKELDKIRSRRFNIRPGDRENYNKSIEEEQKLLEKRDQLLKVTAQFQQNLEADKANVKAAIEVLDELAAKKGITAQSEAQIRQTLESRLEDIEKTRVGFEDLTSSLAKSVNALELALRNLNESAAYFNETLDRSANTTRAEFLRQSIDRGYGSQIIDLGSQYTEQDVLTTRLTFFRDQLDKVNGYLSSPEFSGVLEELQNQTQGQGLNLENTATIERLLGEGRNSQETAVLNALKQRLEAQNQIASTEEQLAQSIVSARTALFDLNKSVEDYFFNLTQQIREGLNEVDKLVQKLKYGDIKNRLQRALVPGSDTFINGIVQQIQGIFDQAAAITESIFGQKSARINFDGERYSLQTELVNFARNLTGASDAIKAFTEALGGRQNVLNQKPQQAQQATQSGGTVKGVVGYVGKTGIGSGPHLHIDGRNKDGSAMSKERLQQLEDLFFANGKRIDSYTMTSGYGPRSAPVPGASTNHKAFDYGIPEGTPIVFKGNAVKIQKKPNQGTGGNTLLITLESGEVIRLLHLQKFGTATVQNAAVTQTPQNLKPGQNISGLANDSLFQKLVLAEANGQGLLGMAIVARSVMNRQALIKQGAVTPGTYNARSSSLRDIIYAPSQYQPISDGRINTNWTKAQLEQARQAIALAHDTQKLREQMRQAGISSAQTRQLMSATGFRTPTAFDDKSQNYNRSRYKGHVFNQDAFSIKKDVLGLFDRQYGGQGVIVQSQSLQQPTQPQQTQQSQTTTALESAQQKQPYAADLNDLLLKIKNKQIDLNDQSVRQEIESLFINLSQTKEAFDRQMSDSIRTTRNSVIDAQNQFQDLKDQYSPQTQTSQLAQEVRGIETAYRNFDNQLFEQERLLTDHIRGVDGLLTVINENQPLLDQFKASDNPAQRESALFLESLKPQLETDIKIYSEKLKEIQAIRSQLNYSQTEALDFAQAGAQIRALQSDLERMEQELTVYQQANNLEGERALGILKSRRQLSADILKIQQDFADNPTEAASRIETAEKLAAQREREIQYQYESKKLSQEMDIISREANIAKEKSNLEAQKETALLQSQKQLEQEILEIKKQYLDLSEQESRIKLATEQAALRERQILNDYQNQLLNRQQQVRDFDSQIAEGQAGLIDFGGNPYESATIRENNAFENENFRYQQQVQQLQQQYADDPETLSQLIEKAKQLNEINLDNIDNQFRDLGETLEDLGKNAFSTFLEDTLTFTKGIGEAFRDMALNILKSIASIAAKMAINALFGGKGFNFFSDGGTVEDAPVPNFAEGGTIVDALSREGPQGVLAVFTPGEEVLSIKNGEAQRYQWIKNRLGKNPLKKLSLNFAEGGTARIKGRGNLAPQRLTIEDGLLRNLNISSPQIAYMPSFADNYSNASISKNQSVNITVVTPDVGGFNRSERQMGRMAAEYLSRG